jgi:TPR repeat protein
VAAQYALSLMLSEGLGGPAQPDTARAWLEHGLAHGGGQDRALITQLAYLLSEAIGGPAHLARALTLYEQAAAMDDTTALHNLALAYQHGRGVRTHRGEALALFRRAERLGDLSCAFHVGALLAEHAQVLQGAERRQCLDEAGYFLRKLLDQPGTLHEDDACAELAQICLMPEAAAHDPAQAEALLLRGAALENAACMQLLVDRFYANPASGRADEALARQWAERARQTH